MSLDGCSMIRKPSLALIYVFVTGGNPVGSVGAHKFAGKLRECPAGIDHEVIVVCNGPAPSEGEVRLFEGVRNVRFIQDDDRAYDISAFQTASKQTQAEMLVFVGGNTWVTGAGWGSRIMEVYREHGMAIYGAMGNQGNIGVGVYPHLRTTGFWMPRALFLGYPYAINHVHQRYEAEHGKTSFTEWVRQQGLPALVVGWNAVVGLAQADTLPNGYVTGDRSNLIFRDRMTGPPFYNG